MRRLSILTLLATALLWTSCGTVPITGRKQVLLVSDQEVLASSFNQYSTYMSTAPRSANTSRSAMVTRVGQRIAAATEHYLRQNGLESELANFAWEFNLVNDKQANAFCMPGGKIVVYEGLMELVVSEDELAVVVGHEVAHAVAKHSNERMSQQMLTEYGAQILGAAVSQKSEMVQSMAAQVYGLGAEYGLSLPFSRKHELEADYMGLILMTIAGYNPDVAVGFWQKMSAGGAQIPEFMSTHPSDTKRIKEIQNELPKIKKQYQTGSTPSASATKPAYELHFPTR